MMSSLSNLADRNFVIGYLLPVIVTIATASGLFPDVPFIAILWDKGQSIDNIVAFTSVILATWLIAVLLLVANTSLYRILEGYTGPFANARLSARKQQRAQDEWDEVERLERAQSDAKSALDHCRNNGALFSDRCRELDAAYRTVAVKHAEARYKYHQHFPFPVTSVLPTDFGNIIRAAEAYPLEVYGAEAISTWPRLIGVVPEAYQKVIDAARAEVDFFVNLCFLSFLISVATDCWLLNKGIEFCGLTFWNWHLGWANVVSDPDRHEVLLHVFAALCAMAVSFMSYKFSVSRASAWGTIVRSTFDLYLPALAKALGYDAPNSDVERKKFWRGLAKTFLQNLPI